MTTQPLWELLAGASVYDLSHPYETGMPQSPNHPPFRMLLERRHGDMVRSDGGSAANELIVFGGHVGTHVDAIAHVSQDGLVFGGLVAADLQSNRGFSELGIDQFQPYAGRAVLLDVARLHGLPALPAGYEVTADDLESARAAADVTIGQEEVIVIGTGWSRCWRDKAAFVGQVDGAPGPGVDAAEWLCQFTPRAVGAETIAFEQIQAGTGHAQLPVHRIMLVEQGINIVETMNLDALLTAEVGEFFLVLNPLPIKGATGAPVRPLAFVTAP
jgi:kynurenine formamidase